MEKFTVLGVHPVKTLEPCHLIEVEIEGIEEGIDFGEITQEAIGEPRDNWPVPYDERILEKKPGSFRYAFFFHHLNFNRPLLTPMGPAPLPGTTPIPAHLQDIRYEAP